MAITQQNIKIGDKRDIQPWVSGVTYQEREEVDINNSIYIALVSHVSTDFATDLAAAKWQVIGGGGGGSPSAGASGDLQFSDGSGGFQTNNIQAFASNFNPTVNLGMNLGTPTRRWISVVGREHLADTGRGGNVGYGWTGLPNDAINNGGGTGGGIGIKTRSAEKVKVSNQNSTTTGIVLIQDGIPATSNAVVSALLELGSTTKGFLEPRMTGAQIEAIASPATGLKAYATNAGAGDVTSAGWWGYNGSNWVQGYAAATPSVYGTNLNVFVSAAESNTSAPHTTWVNKITDTTTSLQAGDYELVISYGWNHNATNSDFESRLSFDGTILGDIFSNGTTHKEEPKDSAGTGGGSGSSQQLTFTKSFILTGVSAGTKAVVFDFRSDDTGDLSTVWDASIKLIRIS